VIDFILKAKFWAVKLMALEAAVVEGAVEVVEVVGARDDVVVVVVVVVVVAGVVGVVELDEEQADTANNTRDKIKMSVTTINCLLSFVSFMMFSF
jgi:hypothetical protein